MAAPRLSTALPGAWRTWRHRRYAERAPRYLASAVLALFLGLGIRSCFLAPAVPQTPRHPAADAPSQDLALQFARAYLTYDAAHPGVRARALAPYIGGGGLSPGAGFAPIHGRQLVRWADVASDQPALAGGRLITVAASVSTQRLPLYLAVTVNHPRAQPLRLVGYPSLVGAPSTAPPAAAPAREPVSDPALIQVVDRVLRNYLAGSTRDLEADLSPSAQVTLPTIRLRLDEVQELLWLGAPGSGAVLATLTATGSGGATYTLTYELGIAYRERPYIDFIEVIPTES